ncbi:MAG TPA: molybdenum cofactor guanylyltransferase [Gaiellaceae bacterium]|nr:molybdenum cofactor guanylyltransferase [Gaiellaceae bacterium]
MADRLTGVLLVGGASTRFGSPKALARFEGEALAERAWRILGEACDERIAIGKGDETLPFPVLADGVEERAAIHGLVAGLRAARTDVCVVLPVDCPRMTPAALRALADACRDAAVSQTGPLPGAYRKSALPALTRGELSIRQAISGLDVAIVELDETLLLNVNTPDDVRL